MKALNAQMKNAENAEMESQRAQNETAENAEMSAENAEKSAEHAETLRLLRPALRSQRAQSALEYVVVAAAVAAALLAMAVYMKRGFSGNLRASADSVSEQYHPKHSSSDITQTFSSDTKTVSTLWPDQLVGVNERDEPIFGDTMETVTTITKDTSRRTGSETVGALTGDVWD